MSAMMESTESSQKVESILLAAEGAFSETGFDGCGMKAIAERAGVSQALLHYHFGTKERLYAEVIATRSSKINDERIELLSKVDMTSEDALAGVLDALFRPPLGPSGGSSSYGRIFSALFVGQEREQALVQKHYDPTARRFIAAIADTLPDADREAAAMGYTLALGALVAVIGRTGRVERLMGRDQPQDVDELLRSLVRFSEGGVRALAGADA